MNTLNHLTLGQIDAMAAILTECDLTLTDYGDYLKDRTACLGNLIEYICYEAVEEAYKQLTPHFKAMGDQIVCITEPYELRALLNKLNPYIETSYAWDFLNANFAMERAA